MDPRTHLRLQGVHDIEPVDRVAGGEEQRRAVGPSVDRGELELAAGAQLE
jgi:hypothetical protein